MSRHYIKRQPRGHIGFAWGRFPWVYSREERRDHIADGYSPYKIGEILDVEYRLFRRDHTGRTHIEVRRFLPSQSRAEIAGSLWRARNALRERVDAMFFEAQRIAA